MKTKTSPCPEKRTLYLERWTINRSAKSIKKCNVRYLRLQESESRIRWRMREHERAISDGVFGEHSWGIIFGWRAKWREKVRFDIWVNHNRKIKLAQHSKNIQNPDYYLPLAVLTLWSKSPLMSHCKLPSGLYTGLSSLPSPYYIVYSQHSTLGTPLKL